MTWKNRYYIRLSQFAFPESLDSLTVELNDLRINTFNTVEGAQRLVEKLKELHDSSIRMYRSFWNVQTQKSDMEQIQVYELVAGEISETAYQAISTVFEPLAKYKEIIASQVTPKYHDTIMVLSGLHIINPMNHFDLKICIDTDF
jgi:hypothetical protein